MLYYLFFMYVQCLKGKNQTHPFLIDSIQSLTVYNGYDIISLSFRSIRIVPKYNCKSWVLNIHSRIILIQVPLNDQNV